MDLKDTLKQIHTLFSENSIDHALLVVSGWPVMDQSGQLWIWIY